MIRFAGKNTARILTAAAAALIAAPAWAHTGGGLHDHGLSLMSGVTHPLFGIDHLLAMLAVGVWAAQHKRSAVWLLPVVFPLMMLAGALLGMNGLHLPGIEAGIAGSVAVLGLLIAFAIRLPVWAGAAVVTVFALAHGYAHGMELPQGASPWAYGAGFMAATFALHLAGMAIGLLSSRESASRVVRFGGAGIAAVGAYLLAGLA